ncbi:3-phenylpropionate-dihydrodiol/cinnamic acid-dihydrodiol dehydrogenase [Pleomorphomonas sp. T1.2MG-36]|uniref:SDR family NAD(P)-dependent oxidoreductase n=1 Tax=Pleomorphomonas sp. T1.2MG-36 TaxID=3041167 RepID=UPI0024778AE2|nr:SDR family NAD(P)-dependent oxidoreductase [Pleomorphomonas sp. T1.2MG-36]CAI9415956.1 3-phenylpropionate-dihydrodiol/cinnamic acid-dihydrodiol dehydrogenase [Pleomorphomonas sp. T1.2MG-36]
MADDIITTGKVAVITGAARGIGRAAALRLAQKGMKLVLADVVGGELAATASAAKAAGSPDTIAVPTDVGDASAVEALAAAAFERFGCVDLLMNNAAIGEGGGVLENPDNWRKLMDVNFWGVVNGVQAFVPRMIEGGRPGYVVNTGSKQGITTPPGNAAYNTSKAAVKVVTEQLAHELRSRGSRLSAHLLIPGWTFTGLTASDPAAEKPAGAWHAVEVVDFMLAGLAKGDFYILCPDNETPRRLDEKRMAWAIGDVIHNRPALSRWHPDFKDAFTRYIEE